jgi:Na+-driven multidrug efflux pump
LCWGIQAAGGLWPAAIWSAIVAGHVTRCALSVLRFRRGHWQRIAVDLRPPAQR